MLTDNKTIHIKVRALTSAYAHANKKRLSEAILTNTIGSSVTSVNKMLANSNEQASIMGDIIAISPNSGEWNRELKNYWNSFAYDISETGKELEIGFIYDIYALDRERYITQINKGIRVAKDQLVTNEDLKAYIDSRIDAVEDNFKKAIKATSVISNEMQKAKMIDGAYKIKYDSIHAIESERYKVGKPINPFEYMLYRYCLVYGDVANERALVSKTNKIRFYLHSDSDIRQEKKDKQDTTRTRVKLLLQVTESIEDMENLLYAMNLGNNIPEDDVDLYEFVEKQSFARESEFIKVANNKNLKTIGTIEKYIFGGILTRSEGSQIIYNPTNMDNPIGHNMDEAVRYFKLQANASVVSELKVRYKNLAN